MYTIETAMRLALIAERRMEDIARADEQDAVLNPIKERIAALRTQIAGFGEPQCGKPGAGFKALEKLRRELAEQEEELREYEESFFAADGATARARHNADMQLWGSKYFSVAELKEARDRPMRAADALLNDGTDAVIKALNEGIALETDERDIDYMRSAIEFFSR